MKKLIVPALVLSVSLFACGGAVQAEEIDALNNDLMSAVEELADEVEEEAEEESELYHSEDGRFNINFLGEPTVKSEMVPTVVGNIEMTYFLYEHSVTEAYMVAYSDYPSELVKQSSVAEILAGAKKGSSTNMGITSFDLEEDIEINGNPGLYFKGRTGTIHAEYKLYMVENRLYQVAILRDGGYSLPERSDDFFNSFELIEEAAE
ncbi:MAG: hypothetical protein KDD41_07530 [Flavobacteriales bacterium]|nr:hypothetical protein [Flavobacteriales bacterium]